MQPVLFYYANLVLCAIVFIELLITFKKNRLLQSCFLLIIASLFAMNYFAITGIENRIQFIVAKFLRFTYVGSTLLALVLLVNPKIPKWFILLMTFSAVAIVGVRLIYFHDINVKALPNIPNHVFSIGADFYSPKTGFRYMFLGLAILAIVIAYYYYQRLLMKLNRESVHYKHLLWWLICFVVPFFLLAIFGVLGNLKMFNENISSYLFAIFSCASIFSFVLRPRFLEAGLFKDGTAVPARPQPAAVA